MPEQYYFTLQLNVTNRCNLRCPHCYHTDHIQHGQLNFADYCQCLRKLLNACAIWDVRPQLILCGGEPLLYSDLISLCDYYHQISDGGSLSLLTNGTLITSAIAEQLSRYNLRMMQVSLDGTGEETHDAVRGRGSFSKTTAGIGLMQMHRFPLSVNVVLSRRNHTEIQKFFRLVQQLNIPRLTFTRFIPIGIGKAVMEAMLSPLELRTTYEEIVHYAKSFGIESNFHDGLFCLVDKHLGDPSPIGYTAVVVAEDGTILLSSRTPIALGNMLTDDFETLWLQHPFLQAIRNRDEHECRKCPYFVSCGGNADLSFAYWGMFHRTDPQCWRQFQKLPPIPSEKRPRQLQSASSSRFIEARSQSMAQYCWNANHESTECIA